MKSFIKSLVNAVVTIAISPLIVLYFLVALIVNKDQAFASFSQFLSLFPGISGSYIRKNFFRVCMGSCSTDTVIGFASLFSQQNTHIETGVYIGPQCNIGLCHIGKDSLIGSGVHILSGKGQHDFSRSDIPVREQGGHFEKITIGEDCWIGNNTVVMANIGKKSVIGAGSVVIHDIPDYSIAAGNPAKIIKTREH